MPAATTTIVRLNAAAPDPTRARLELARLLGASDWYPTGLPSSAILCVRRLRVRAPPGDAVRPPPAWARSVRAHLEQLARTAPRPLHGAVPANAEAVLFADRAELLACLARAWLAGDAATDWWWRGVAAGSRPAVDAAWLETPEAVPAALDHLARLGLAVAFARRLGPVAARRLRVAVQERYGLGSEVVPAPRASPSAEDDTGPAADAPARPAWAPDVAIEELEGEPALLLAAGLALRRAPGRFGARPAVDRGVRAPAADDRAGGGAGRTAAPDDRSTAVRDGGVGPVGPTGEARAAAPDARALAPRPGSTPDAPAPDHAPTLPGSAPAGPRVPATQERARVGAAPAEDLDAAQAQPWPRTIDTAYGGVFFLLDLALALGLYGDFSRPRAQCLALSPWDLLALVGRAWHGERFVADPVWNALAELAGRPADEPPGAGFRPPGSWRLPTGWLAAFPEPATCSWGVRRRRLRARHAEGFALLDVPRSGSLERQWLRERAPYEAQGLRWARARLEATAEEPVTRWCGWLVPYLGARLARALGGPHAGPDLVRQRARVWLGDTDVEVAFALDDHPVEVRLAGLDRDPGWLPAAGRSVRYRFE